MHVEEKVQFFNSESSFGSQSNMSSSRYYDLTNEIVEEVQNIFHTLRKQILPTKQLTNEQKVSYLINRANIISADTIPQHISYLEKINSPKEAKDQLRKCQEKLKKLIKDYNSLYQGAMIHKQFYNIYGKETHKNLFFKKSDAYEQGLNHMNMQPEVVQIPDNSRMKQFKATPRNMYMNVPKTGRTQKQSNDLKEQIVKLKKREQQIRKQSQCELNNQKINCQKRIRLLLQLINSNGQNQDVKKYQNQLIINQTNLQTAYTKISELQHANAKLQSELVNSENFKKSLIEELNGYRKLQSSRMNQFDDLQNRSVHSHHNGQSGKKGANQYQKTIKRLSAQRQLLRNQLNKQRQIAYQRKGSNEQDSSKELNKLRKHLAVQNNQLQKMTLSFDKMRVQVIQLGLENKKLKKQLNSTKQNNQNLKSRAKKFQMNENSITTNVELPRSQKQISIINSLNKFSVNKYEGEGIQGHPYYQLLPKQFKIRFKRACLKSKQLLEKTNGIEVGAITEFLSPNIIRVLIHLTNYSQKDISDMKIKVINPNDNKIQCEVQEVKNFTPNQQLKIPVTVYLKNYPIGPVVLVLDYIQEGKHDLRLLLPVHIFKCMNISRRQQKMMNPIQVPIKNQRKIGKDFGTLKQYFNSQGYSDIQIKVHHQHTKTTFYLDLMWSRQDLTVRYEHIQGHYNITEYFMKTVTCLLQKC